MHPVGTLILNQGLENCFPTVLWCLNFSGKSLVDQLKWHVEIVGYGSATSIAACAWIWGDLGWEIHGNFNSRDHQAEANFGPDWSDRSIAESYKSTQVPLCWNLWLPRGKAQGDCAIETLACVSDNLTYPTWGPLWLKMPQLASFLTQSLIWNFPAQTAHLVFIITRARTNYDSWEKIIEKL